MADNILEINDSEFDTDVLQADKPVIVDFWAPWCGPCRIVAPYLDELSKEYEGKVKVCKLNVDEAPEIASQMNVMTIPTLMLFKDGSVVNQTVGALPKEELVRFISPYLV